MRNTHYTNKKGFTLVETLVAITVLLLVIIGPITVAQKGVQNANFATERVTATFLAQEAIEAVRKERDDQALDAWHDEDGSVNTTPWAPNCASNCAYVAETDSFAAWGAGNNNGRLRFNPTTGKYTHQAQVGAVDSPYTRAVTIVNGSDGGYRVTVDVSWSGRIFGGATQHVYLQTWIYDHYQRFYTLD